MDEVEEEAHEPNMTNLIRLAGVAAAAPRIAPAAPAVADMADLAAPAPAPAPAPVAPGGPHIQPVTTLLSPKAGDPIANLKKKLFYFIAYCDTFHDFSSDRPVKGEGKSVSKSDIGMHRSDFVKWMIRTMEGDQAEPFIRLIEKLRPQSGYTFENNVGREFSLLPTSYILDKFTGPNPTNPEQLRLELDRGGANDMTERGRIRNYLYEIYSLPPGSNQQYQCLKKDNFADPAIPQAKSSLIEINIPAAIYSTGVVPGNLIAFLGTVFPQCRLGGQGTPIKFVEDAASFPRELFGGMLGHFKKVITTQTKWDSAGLSLSQFDENSIPTVNNVMAPSFLAARGSASDISGGALVLNYFNQSNDTLFREGEDPKRITKPGPSVNHLFMHMIVEKDGLPDALKMKYKQLIRVSRFDSKKNLVEPLLAAAGEAEPIAKGQRLRKLTTSKRTGDYENIHSAIEAGALMFTGDEPAFTYAKLNKCPAVYHVNTNASHVFKLYIPPPPNPEDNERKIRENLTTGLLLQCLELRNTFGATAAFYKGYLKNLKNVVFSGNITVAGSAEVGRLLQLYFIKEFDANNEFFKELKKACDIYKNLNIISPEAVIRDYNYEQLKELVDRESLLIPGIAERNQAIKFSNIMALIKKKIPSRFTGSVSSPADYKLFRPFEEEERGDGFLVRAGIKYALEPGTFFPEYKHVESNFEGIARYLRLNTKTANPSLIAKNNRIIQEALAEFEIDAIPQVGQLDATIAQKFAEIDTLVRQAGGRFFNGTKLTRKKNIPGRKKITERKKILGRKKLPVRKYINIDETSAYKHGYTEEYYSSLYLKILSLPASNIPFGFTPKEYADIVLYRIMINNCIHKINMKYENSTPGIPEVNDMSPPNIPRESSKLLADKGDIYKYCSSLYTNSIEPFLRKHFFTDMLEAGEYTPERIYQNILLSIVGGSYFEDLEVVLADIISSPDFAYLAPSQSSHNYKIMVDTASVTLRTIFTKIHLSHANPMYDIRLRFDDNCVSALNIIKENFDTHRKLEIYTDNFFKYIYYLCLFLNNSIAHDKEKTVVSREVCEAAFNPIIQNDAPLSIELVKSLMPSLENYVKYAINDYVDFGNFSGGGEGPAASAAAAAQAAAAAGHGGSFQMKPRIRRRKRNGSPRRKSLKRK